MGVVPVSYLLAAEPTPAYNNQLVYSWVNGLILTNLL